MAANVKYTDYGHSAINCAKMAEPIDKPFGKLSRVDLGNYVLHGLHIGATWRIQVNRPSATAMPPFCQITLTTYLTRSRRVPEKSQFTCTVGSFHSHPVCRDCNKRSALSTVN